MLRAARHHAAARATSTTGHAARGWPAWPRACCIWRRRRGEGSAQWWRDPRTVALLRALAAAQRCRLRWSMARPAACTATAAARGSSETRPVHPRTPRAQRRVDAETAVRYFGRAAHVRASILRIPGIYAPDREGGTPRERLLQGHAGAGSRGRRLHQPHPCRRPGARLRRGAVARQAAARATTSATTRELKMGDYFDLAADLYGLPRPPRVPRSTAQDAVAAGAAELHGRVAPAGQRAPEARAAPAAALPDGASRALAASDPGRLEHRAHAVYGLDVTRLDVGALQHGQLDFVVRIGDGPRAACRTPPASRPWRHPRPAPRRPA